MSREASQRAKKQVASPKPSLAAKSKRSKSGSTTSVTDSPGANRAHFCPAFLSALQHDADFQPRLPPASPRTPTLTASLSHTSLSGRAPTNNRAKMSVSAGDRNHGRVPLAPGSHVKGGRDKASRSGVAAASLSQSSLGQTSGMGYLRHSELYTTALLNREREKLQSGQRLRPPVPPEQRMSAKRERERERQREDRLLKDEQRRALLLIESSRHGGQAEKTRKMSVGPVSVGDADMRNLAATLGPEPVDLSTTQHHIDTAKARLLPPKRMGAFETRGISPELSEKTLRHHREVFAILSSVLSYEDVVREQTLLLASLGVNAALTNSAGEHLPSDIGDAACDGGDIPFEEVLSLLQDTQAS
ncbi:hypothetical protein KIPB_005867 [Kipferlia bialata]|uniref:Uncharacterized protein n=1 Tax=Kipferlia bialata TaxID=797122 RepID=A0A9K3CY62_9EUKA|nr:hypothetical protein KIPB_005867 [Kipferlia bialata]|eukprot:g5867.t1